MKEFLDNLDGKRVLQIALIIGIIILTMNDKEGWGWLMLALFITL